MSKYIFPTKITIELLTSSMSCFVCFNSRILGGQVWIMALQGAVVHNELSPVSLGDLHLNATNCLLTSNLLGSEFRVDLTSDFPLLIWFCELELSLSTGQDGPVNSWDRSLEWVQHNHIFNSILYSPWYYLPLLQVKRGGGIKLVSKKMLQFR